MMTSEADAQPDSGSPIQNGSASTDEKPWLRAWAPSELRKKSTEWSLAADAGLLKYLQEFSTKFMTKAHESTLAINSLVHDTSMTDTKMRNVVDQFLTLSDSQFIENRVYDEDLSAKTSNGSKENSEKESKENEKTEVDALPKLKEAILSGLKVLDEAFEILDANAANSDYDTDSDSDAEDGKGVNGMPSNIYEPKDPYIARPLPHLIGSRGFLETEDVGIKDLPSEDEIQDDQGSISESDEDIEKPSDSKERSDTGTSSDYDDSDTEYSDSEEEKEVRSSSVKKTKKSSFSSSSEEVEQNLFGNQGNIESSEDDESPPPQRKPSKKSKTTQKISQKKKQKVAEKDVDLFVDEHDDEDDLFGNAGGLFGTGSNLFDKKKAGGLFEDADVSDEVSEGDSDQQEDNESQKLSSEEEDNVQEKKPHGGVSLFGGAITKELATKMRRESDATRSDTTASQVSESSTKKSGNLFLEDDDDEGDLFSTQSPSVTAKMKDKSVTRVKAKSFLTESSSESETDNKPPPNIKSTKTKKPAASNLFGSGDSDNDLYGSGKPDKIVKSVESKKTEAKARPKVSANLKKTSKALLAFGSSSDDDSMFSKKPPTMKAPSKLSNVSKSKDLFASDSDDDFFSDLKAKPVVKPSQKSKLNKDSDSDDLFSSVKVERKKSELSTKSRAKSNEENIKKIKSDSLFSEGSEKEDSEIEEKPAPKKKPAGAVSMFGGALGGAELFSAISKRRTTSEVSTKSSSSAEVQADNSSRKNSEANLKENKKETVEAPKVVDKSEGRAPKPFYVATKPVIVLPPAKKIFVNVSAKPFKPFGSPVSGDQPKPVISPIGKLHSKLSIDPSTLLPGAAPKAKPVVKAEISFDKPPVANTLESVNKTRARGQANRRPPSRHGKTRQSQSTPATTSTAPEISASVVEIPTETEAPKVIDKPKFEKPSSAKLKIFAIPTAKQTEEKSKKEALIDSEDIDAELFSGSLFAKSTSMETKSKKAVPKLFDNSDIFGNDSNEADIFSSTKGNKEKKSGSGLKLMDDDDIFGDLDLTGGILSKKSKSAVKDDDIFGNDKNETSADLFGDNEKRENIKPKKGVKITEDDIFGDLTVSTKQKITKAKKVVDDFDIFGDDSNDIFSDNISKKSKNSPKPQKKKIDNLFGDNTAKKSKDSPKLQKKKVATEDDDIFSDTKPAVASTKKETKTSKKTKTSKSAASIFDDDPIDDIFKSITTKKSTTKTKKSTTKTTSKKEETEPNVSVINDPLSMP